MKYKIGDKVRIVNHRTSEMNDEGSMDKYLGTIMTIKEIRGPGHYKMQESEHYWDWYDDMIEGFWDDDMIEGLVETPNPKIDLLDDSTWTQDMKYIAGKEKHKGYLEFEGQKYLYWTIDRHEEEELTMCIRFLTLNQVEHCLDNRQIELIGQSKKREITCTDEEYEEIKRILHLD